MNNTLNILIFLSVLYFLMIPSKTNNDENDDLTSEREIELSIIREKEKMVKMEKKELDKIMQDILKEDEVLVKSFYIFINVSIQILLFIMIGNVTKYDLIFAKPVENKNLLIRIIVHLILCVYSLYLFYELYKSYQRFETMDFFTDMDVKDTDIIKEIGIVVKKNFGKHNLLKRFNEVLLTILLIVSILQLFTYLYLFIKVLNKKFSVKLLNKSSVENKRQVKKLNLDNLSDEQIQTMYNEVRNNENNNYNLEDSRAIITKWTKLNLGKLDNLSDERRIQAMYYEVINNINNYTGEEIQNILTKWVPIKNNRSGRNPGSRRNSGSMKSNLSRKNSVSSTNSFVSVNPMTRGERLWSENNSNNTRG